MPDEWRGYWGTKRVDAVPSAQVVVDGDPVHEVPGYAVRYADGYVSWSPKDVFDAAYKPEDACDFSGALAAMKAGHAIMRPQWKITEAWVLVEGIVVEKVCRWRVSSIRLCDILAVDWIILP